jgi:hypothetical protein
LKNNEVCLLSPNLKNVTYFIYIFPFQALIMRLTIISTYIFTLAFGEGKNYGCGGTIRLVQSGVDGHREHGNRSH